MTKIDIGMPTVMDKGENGIKVMDYNTKKCEHEWVKGPGTEWEKCTRIKARK